MGCNTGVLVLSTRTRSQQIDPVKKSLVYTAVLLIMRSDLPAKLRYDTVVLIIQIQFTMLTFFYYEYTTDK